MSDGVINSPSGAHERKVNITSGLVVKDKSTYSQLHHNHNSQSVQNYRADTGTTYKIRHVDFSPQRLSNGTLSSAPVKQYSATTTRAGQTKTYSYAVNQEASQASKQDLSSYETQANVSTQPQRVSQCLKQQNGNRNPLLSNSQKNYRRFKSAAKKTGSAAVKGVSYLSHTESYQNQGTGEKTAYTLEKGAVYTLNKGDRLVTKGGKSGKSRYFRVVPKASQGVLNVGMRILNSSDDIGAQTVVRSIDTAVMTYRGGKIAVKTSSKAIKYTAKATKKTVKTSVKLVKKSVKAVRTAAKAAHKAGQAAIQTAKMVAAAAKEVIAFLVSNPVGWIICAIVAVVLLVLLCFSGAVGGGVNGSSYGGTGGATEAVSYNQTNEVYDYINQSITKQCRDLFNLHSSWTGFLKYEYKFEKEDYDGNVTALDSVPTVDVAPIMAYLGTKYQSYKLDDTIKNEVDNIVAQLYTLTYVREPYSYSVDHGNGGTTTYTGEKITFTIRYHNTERFIEEHNLIPAEKLSAYANMKNYGEISYFRMHNVFKDKDWREWIGAQFGYTLSSQVSGIHDIQTFSMTKTGYTEMKFLNAKGERADKIYSPIDGVVSSIEETDDYFIVLTLKDTTNNLEFQVMSEQENKLIPTVNVGDSIKAGQLIANNTYDFHMVCIYNDTKTNPLLLMEYYARTDNGGK